MKIREISRIGRSERIEDKVILSMLSAGHLFAKDWHRFRRFKSTRNEAQLLRSLRKAAGPDLAIAFFVRAEGAVPVSLPLVLPQMFTQTVRPLPVDCVISEKSVYSSHTELRSFTGVDLTGRIEVKPEIRLDLVDRTFLIEDVALYGGSGIIRGFDGVIWPNYKFEEAGNGLYPWDSVLLEHARQEAVLRPEFGEPPLARVDEALSLLDSSARHFGHFAWGLIPRLRILHDTMLESDRLTILVGNETPKSILRMLNFWGHGDRLLQVPRGSRIDVGKLFMPSPLKYFPDIMPAAITLENNSRALAKVEFDFLFPKVITPKEPGKRVFLLREGTAEGGWRKCMNHPEIRESLEKQGFRDLSKLLTSPELLFEELQTAEVVVLDDGSISANALLAGIRGAQILFLTHPGIAGGGHNAWWSQGYFAVQGNQVTSLHVSVLVENDRTSDWWLDTGALHRELLRF